MQFLWQKLERFSIKMTPAVLTVVMVLLAAVPSRIPGASQLMPVFALISIYYWETFCPGSLPYVFICALGLLEDTLTGLPLGLSSAVNIVFALLLVREHRGISKGQFGGVWIGFLLLSLVALTLEWVIMSIYLGQVLPLASQLLQWVATCLAYPPVHLLLTRVYRALLE